MKLSTIPLNVPSSRSMWVLGHAKNPKEISKLMQTNLASEITLGTRPDVFLKPSFAPTT